MPPRGAYAKSAAIRQEILDTALRVVAERGFGNATMQEIADAVGMSKAGVLHHFGSREQLFAEILDRRDDRQAVADVEQLFALVDANAEVPGLVALFSAVVGSAAAEGAGNEGRRIVQERYERVVRAITEVVQRHPDWTGDVLDATTAARLLVATMDGLQTQWLLGQPVDMTASLRALWASWTR
jgi:AcrR family transcriptional regulator